MDTFNFDFDTDSTLTNDTNSNHSHLDWTAFQSAPPLSSSPTTITNNPFSPTWLSQQDDAVAPDNRANLMTTPPHDDGIYFEIDRFFNGFNQQQDLQYEQGFIEPIHVNMQIPEQINHLEPSHRVHLSSIMNERPLTCLPTPLVPRLSSSRSQCYHKLPDHAVKLMQEWYNANLDDPYPRSPDKKRFITEGNITAQQCRSWFANRRQRLKHVKRNQLRRFSSRSRHAIQTRLTQIPSIEEQAKIHEQCYYCQQQQQQQTTAMTTTTTTLNVVINQQTVEQLIHNSLRKLFYSM